MNSKKCRYRASCSNRHRARTGLLRIGLFAAAIAAAAIWPMVARNGDADAFGFQEEVVLAYVDPGSAGFIITVVLGFLAAFGYTARVWLQRLKRLLRRGKRTDHGDSNDGAAAGR